MHMISKLLFFEKIYLFSKNPKQPKYEQLLKTFDTISEECGDDVVEVSNDEIIPVDELNDDNQKIFILMTLLVKKKTKTSYWIFR